jgi:hypothetical protein
MSAKSASPSPLFEGGQIGRPRLNNPLIQSAMHSRFATKQGEYMTGDLGSKTSRTCRRPVGVSAFGPDMNTLPAQYILRILGDRGAKVDSASPGGGLFSICRRGLPSTAFEGQGDGSRARPIRTRSGRGRLYESGPVRPLSCRQNLNLEVN